MLAVLTCHFVSRLENPNAPDRDSVLEILLETASEISAPGDTAGED